MKHLVREQKKKSQSLLQAYGVHPSQNVTQIAVAGKLEFMSIIQIQQKG